MHVQAKYIINFKFRLPGNHNDMKKNILITGGAGFVGSHIVRHFVKKYPGSRIVNFDNLTYSGNLENLTDIENSPNYTFVKGDITDFETVLDTFHHYSIGGVINLAAESRIDRKVNNPFMFAKTNILGTLTLLEAAKGYWDKDFTGKLFYHISTDEIYGSLDKGERKFTETTRYDPQNPFSASKASSDHFARAFFDTYGLPVIISNSSNNYGPNQFPNKFIPLLITNILKNESLPVYGKGENLRDWLYVEDHAKAVDLIYHQGKAGETYNIGGLDELKNIEVVETIIKTADRLLGRRAGASLGLISFVLDADGHDMRYSMNTSKLKDELGWEPETSFEQGIEKTVQWYIDNPQWLANIENGEYMEYYEKKYKAISKIRV